MSEVVAENEWKQDSPYRWTHASGWTIGRYVVSSVSRFMLWQGWTPQGPFDRLEEAQKPHVVVTKA